MEKREEELVSVAYGANRYQLEKINNTKKTFQKPLDKGL